MIVGSFYERRGKQIVAISCLMLPLVSWCATKALESNSNDIHDWLPQRHEITADYHWFRRCFGNDEFILISWEGCTLDDPRLTAVGSRLTRLDAEAADGPLFERVATSRTVLDDLMRPPSDLSQEVAVARLRGSFLGPDGRQACAVVWLSVRGRRGIHAYLPAIRAAVTECGVPPEAAKYGGPPVANTAIDVVSAESMEELLGLTCAVGFLIAWLTIRDLRPAMLVLWMGVYAMALSLAAVWLCQVPMNGYLITMVPLVYVTATSGAIHLCNYYRENVRRGARRAASNALAHAMLPLGLAAGTTAAGLLSICYTDLAPIRLFGFFSAVGVVLSWLLLVICLPAALVVFAAQNSGAAQPTSDLDDPAISGEALPAKPVRRLGAAIIARPGLTAAALLSAVIVCLPGMARNTITIDVMREFTPEARVVRDYVWLEQHLGLLMPIEVILRFDDEKCSLNLTRRLQLVERIQRRIETFDAVGATISAATFGPAISRTSGLIQRIVVEKKLVKNRDRLIQTGYLAECEGEQLWRISARVASLDEVDFGEHAERIHALAESMLHNEPGCEEASIVCTGAAPALYKARRSLIEGLFLGLCTDLILIVSVVALTMRHLLSGLIIAVSSVFPTTIVLGLTGWLGVTLDQGAIFAPCVALGVSVDDAIHLLVWYRWGIRQGFDKKKAVETAWNACARPMYQSWMLLGMGMLTLAVSEFIPYRQFGLMMAALLTAGLVGNLLLLPALLAGPLGRLGGPIGRA